MSHPSLPFSDAPVRRLFLALATVACLGFGAPSALGQSYPNKPIRLVVGSPNGALVDILARLSAQKLGESMGQPIVVDNKPGAAMIIAADLVAKAPGDGYTLLLAPDGAMVMTPFVYSKLPFDASKDFQPIGVLGMASLAMVVSPKLGVKSMDEFIKLAKSRPGAVDYGSAGIGHPVHIAMEMVAAEPGISLSHVPYKGTSLAIQDVVSGQIGGMIVGMAEALPFTRDGRAIALAASGPQAKEVFPSLPELKDFHPDLSIAFWVGLFAPAATPRQIVTRLNNELNRALQSPDVTKRLSEFGFKAQPGSVADVESLIQSDRAKYGPLIKSLGIKAD